ncbi:MAG TPA: acyl-CoA dehydratase activase-related protein [Chroococcales cyanobacterium]|jgi:predicted nucleotide-binding protein (sugar kinase/HSP70/actin superfamily)
MAALKIGIARSFVYFAHDPDWASFFAILGHEVVYSAQTKEGLLDSGKRYCNNDDCLPMKHYYGHAFDLANRADILFVPQLVSLKKEGNCCPKVIAIPQLIKNGLSHISNIISVVIDANHPHQTRYNVAKLASQLSSDPLKIFRAAEHLMARLFSSPPQPSDKPSSGKSIGLLGHGYSLQDKTLNLDLLARIERYGYQVTLPNPTLDGMTSHATHGSVFGCKAVHWDCGQRLVNTAGYYLSDENIVGIITVTFFGCGIDAFVEEVYKQRLCQSKPYLTLSLDEHTGEAGLLTRLEAFLDMMARRS